MSDVQKYEGGCHCGKVRYEVSADLSGQLATCNCSICSKTGAIMAFVPAASFTLRSGEEALSDYQFNKKKIHHLFCSTCGVRSFGRGVGPGGAEMVMLNVRCLDGVDLHSLKTHEYDGKSL